MAQPPEMPQRLIKIFVESGLDEIRRIEDQAVGELLLRSPRKMMADSPPRGDSRAAGNESGSKDENESEPER